MPQDPNKSFLWLGKYMSLAMVLPASVFAGYFLGTLADRWLHTRFCVVLGILLGMAAGLIKIVQELTRDEKRN